MTKLNELTSEQTAKLAVYRDKWLKIGLQTGPADRPKAEAAIMAAYKAAELTPPEKVVWGRSPAELLKLAKKEGITGIALSDFCFGQHDAAWLAFYSYCINELGVKNCEKLEPLIELARHANWWLPFDKIAFISERPVEIHRKGTVSHKDGGPAILYADGFGVWVLNGVRVSREIAETPRHKLNAKLVLTTTNAEIRREIVRKIGIETVCEKLGAEVIDECVLFSAKRGKKAVRWLDIGKGKAKVSYSMPTDITNISTGLRWLDEIKSEKSVMPVMKIAKVKLTDKTKLDEYQLVLLNVGDSRSRPWLKMLNPSIQVYHMEGVPANIMTVDEALHWRNDSTEHPGVLT
jgi:hypothetical protein